MPGKYFTWTILTRDDVYWADGRSNPINAGRHSRGTKCREEAIALLARLDLIIAIENKLAEPEALVQHADGYVFHGPLGGRLKADTVRNILVRDVLTPLSKRFPTPAGEIGFRDGRLYRFRHFFCSLCANNNVPQQTVMRWLGHRDSKLVAHYYHLHDDEAKRQMQKIRLQGSDLAAVPPGQ